MSTATSQYGEHEVILKYFAGKTGRFLDVGAHDGHTFSNTAQLYEAGWSGVLVEPSPSVFPYLMQFYRDKPCVELVHAAIGERSEIVRWWENHSGDCLSTSYEGNYAKFSAIGHPFTPIWMPTITWQQLLDAQPGPYNFVNIDVEGINTQLLMLAPLEGVEMMCVEADPDKDIPLMKKRLSALGLQHISKIGGNLLASRRPHG